MAATGVVFKKTLKLEKKLKFSIFSKFSKNKKIFKKQSKIRGEPPYYWKSRLTIFYLGGNLLVTLKTMKNYNSQAHFQKMEKSDL